MAQSQVHVVLALVVIYLKHCDTIPNKHSSSNYDLFRSNFIYPKDQQDTLSFFIIGGAEAVPHYFPYVVAIQVQRFDNYSFFCAGTLISTQWVLTAAHCLDKTNYTTLHFGRHNLSAPESSQVNMVSQDFVIHEEWNETLLLNDIGLIYLSQEVNLTEEIKTIEVASGNDSYANVTAYSMGWGMTNLGKQSDVLRYLDVKILENSICKTNYRLYTDAVRESHLCTSGEGIVGTCKGDSGGPLVYQNRQIGISSFGYTSCFSEKPSVYTRLTKYTDWLKEKTNITFNSTEESVTTESVSNKSLKKINLCFDLVAIFVGYLLSFL